MFKPALGPIIRGKVIDVLNEAWVPDAKESNSNTNAKSDSDLCQEGKDLLFEIVRGHEKPFRGEIE